MPKHKEDLAQFAMQLADLGREFLRGRFRSGTELDFKADGTPVTPADRELEELYRERILARFPDHGILGEEGGAQDLEAEHVWVLDPIDGTKAFAGGKPLFVSLIALLRERRPVVGVIEAPATEERWIGVEGGGTRYNGVPVHVSSGVPLERSVVVAGAPFAPALKESLPRLHERVGWLMYQLDGYGYGLLANGHVHAVVEVDLAVYDCCALDPVVRNAGGVIHTWDGLPIDLVTCGKVIAACDADQAERVLATLLDS